MKQTPLKPIGKRGRKTLNARRKMNQYLRDEWVECVAKLPGICTGRAVDNHELLPRSLGGSATDKDNIIPVCRMCHSWITDHTAEAEARGLHRSRYGLPRPKVREFQFADSGISRMDGEN